MSQKAFGSGNFGEWIEDPWGLPAYFYTCDQIRERRAVTPTNPAWRSPTDHLHQVGNDRLVGIASNYGHIQVRQDEGSPKFLNDFDPANGHFAGGFGYLTDGQTMLSTYYTGQGGTFERVFGVGYLRKTVEKDGYTADQVVFAPFGDDPLLISQVTITNRTDRTADLRWIEYWGCQMHQFSYRAYLNSLLSRGKKRAPDLRREFTKRFTGRFTPVADRAGLLYEQRFLGFPLKEKIGWEINQVILGTIGKKVSGGAVREPIPETRLEDLTPPPVFLVSLDGAVDGISTDEAGFFGRGGVTNPDGLLTPLPEKHAGAKAGPAFLFERRFHLDPSESKTLSFAYGYLPNGFRLDDLVHKYSRDLPGLWKRSSEAWKRSRVKLEVPGESWIDRELTWHNYYLRANLTYDSFFQEHILSQGTVYQYVIGFQGAARDPLQHALPFIYTQPQLVKEILRYTLKEVQPDGEIPYGIVGHGLRMAAPFRPSDQELWLLWLASEYVLATRDSAFLEENLPTYPLYGPTAGQETVRGLLARCCRHLVNVTGCGRHGLVRLSNGDWNDGVVVGFVTSKEIDSVHQQGESVLNAAFASYALRLYADMLAWVGDAAEKEARDLAEEQARRVREQWTGQWFRRAWLNEHLGWIGEDVMWLEPQPWAILGGAATAEQREILVKAIDDLMRTPSAIGAMILSKPIDRFTTPPGVMLNAGVWPSINGTLVWALAKVDGVLAWDEWKKNSLAWHAEAHPDVWYGIWSGPDAYSSLLSTTPGQTLFAKNAQEGETLDRNLGLEVNWTDFPVMDMHPHAWPLYDVVKLLGAEFTPAGLELAPVIPLEKYAFQTPLLGLEKSDGCYNGWYMPGKGGRWQINLLLPEGERARVTKLEVNGQSQPLEWDAQGRLSFSGESLTDQPLRWVVL